MFGLNKPLNWPANRNVRRSNINLATAVLFQISNSSILFDCKEKLVIREGERDVKEDRPIEIHVSE